MSKHRIRQLNIEPVLFTDFQGKTASYIGLLSFTLLAHYVRPKASNAKR